MARAREPWGLARANRSAPVGAKAASCAPPGLVSLRIMSPQLALWATVFRRSAADEGRYLAGTRAPRPPKRKCPGLPASPISVWLVSEWRVGNLSIESSWRRSTCAVCFHGNTTAGRMAMRKTLRRLPLIALCAIPTGVLVIWFISALAPIRIPIGDHLLMSADGCLAVWPISRMPTFDPSTQTCTEKFFYRQVSPSFMMPYFVPLFLTAAPLAGWLGWRWFLRRCRTAAGVP